MTALPAPARYLLVSGLCLATHVSVMVAADRAGWNLLPALALSFCVVVLLGYVLHSRLTFSVEQGFAAFLRYTAAMAAGLPVSTVMLWILSRVAGWPMAIAAPAGAVATLMINFLLVRWALVRHSSNHRRCA